MDWIDEITFCHNTSEPCHSSSLNGARIVTLEVRPRIWRDSVLDALVRVAERRPSGTADRRGLIAEELDTIVSETHSTGATPSQTVSRIVQELRDEGVIEFLGGGKYRLIQKPIHIETSNLSDREIDLAIEKRLLRLGVVETGEQTAATRRRRGQDRVRALTLRNYKTQCAVCDVRDPSLLVASHIQPWAAAPDARGDLSNILCLCRFHDALFERGYWSLREPSVPIIRGNLKSATIRLLLPDNLAFRQPVIHRPAELHLRVHRFEHGFDK